MTALPAAASDNPRLGIVLIVIGMACVSVQDVLIKQLAGDYPLHQIVFARSAVAIVFSFAFIHWEGGLTALKTDTPGLHLVRALLVVLANMTYFAALAVMPLADATALFFVAPLFITLLSIPILGEPVGPRRLIAVVVGFCGVVVMMRPGFGGEAEESSVVGAVLILPVLAALFYALNQMMTRRLGIKAPASAMAIYIQGTFLIVSTLFFLTAGDGRFALGSQNESVQFLLRSWRWPQAGDEWLFLGCGLTSAIVGYCLSQAYRIADAASVAPFEYVALPLAVFWGWLIWDDLPDAWAAVGMALILGAGIYVFVREQIRGRSVSRKRPLRRW